MCISIRICGIACVPELQFTKTNGRAYHCKQNTNVQPVFAHLTQCIKICSHYYALKKYILQWQTKPNGTGPSANTTYPNNPKVQPVEPDAKLAYINVEMKSSLLSFLDDFFNNLIIAYQLQLTIIVAFPLPRTLIGPKQQALLAVEVLLLN